MVEFAPYYYTIYMMVVMLLTVYQFSVIQPLRRYGVLYQRDNYMPMIIFTVFFILMYGLRPISIIFGDTVNYNSTYKVLQTVGTSDGDLPAEFDSDWLFYHFMALCAQVVDVYCFFVIIIFE